MIPNVTRGSSFSRLLAYLVGPGRSNEHTSPHLVGGDPLLMSWFGNEQLSGGDARRIAAFVGQPQRVSGVQVTGGHVWHCSLAVRAEEGLLGDQRWAEIAADFVAGMGFTGDDVTGACRWVAVHHGTSTNGNDHVHLVVDLVREDGTRASVHHDYRRAQQVARELEVRHGLEPLESVGRGATRGWRWSQGQEQARARAAAAHNAGGGVPWSQLSARTRDRLVAEELAADPHQPLHVLAVRVRGAAAAASDEADFVHRMRGEGLLVRPWFATGRTDVVTGYAVAVRPPEGGRPIWFGGGRLGRDLSLPRVRALWPDTPEAAAAAVAAWRGTPQSGGGVAGGAVPGWGQTHARLVDLNRRLESVPIEDHAQWAATARGVAGVLAAWSNATEQTPGDLWHAAQVLSRSAQTYRTNPVTHPLSALADAARVVSTLRAHGRGTMAEAMLAAQLVITTIAVVQAIRAAGERRQAEAVLADVTARLAVIAAPAGDPPHPGQPRWVEQSVGQRTDTTPADTVRADTTPAHTVRADTTPADTVRADTAPHTAEAAAPAVTPHPAEDAPPTQPPIQPTPPTSSPPTSSPPPLLAPGDPRRTPEGERLISETRRAFHQAQAAVQDAERGVAQARAWCQRAESVTHAARTDADNTAAARAAATDHAAQWVAANQALTNAKPWARRTAREQLLAVETRIRQTTGLGPPERADQVPAWVADTTAHLDAATPRHLPAAWATATAQGLPPHATPETVQALARRELQTAAAALAKANERLDLARRLDMVAAMKPPPTAATTGRATPPPAGALVGANRVRGTTPPPPPTRTPDPVAPGKPPPVRYPGGTRRPPPRSPQTPGNTPGPQL